MSFTESRWWIHPWHFLKGKLSILSFKLASFLLIQIILAVNVFSWRLSRWMSEILITRINIFKKSSDSAKSDGVAFNTGNSFQHRLNAFFKKLVCFSRDDCVIYSLRRWQAAVISVAGFVLQPFGPVKLAISSPLSWVMAALFVSDGWRAETSDVPEMLMTVLWVSGACEHVSSLHQ